MASRGLERPLTVLVPDSKVGENGQSVSPLRRASSLRWSGCLPLSESSPGSREVADQVYKAWDRSTSADGKEGSLSGQAPPRGVGSQRWRQSGGGEANEGRRGEGERRGNVIDVLN